MDWFERITGFKEQDYKTTQGRLSVVNGRLVSAFGPRAPRVGRLELPSLAELRTRAGVGSSSLTRLKCVLADVRALHADPSNAGALFQVASQFNVLEMTGPSITPEHGVTRYQDDKTQGPACAIAAGAATIYRNYLVNVDGWAGQGGGRQIDCLRDLGDAVGNHGGRYWRMRNGYAMADASGLADLDRLLAGLDAAGMDGLKATVRIGLHWEVEVTEGGGGHVVSQAFCSALPVAYCGARPELWRRFAGLVLEAAYEATLVAGVINRQDRGNEVVYLTRLGGGAFGNADEWIDAAMLSALDAVRHAGLDVRIVCYHGVPDSLRRLVDGYSQRRLSS